MSGKSEKRPKNLQWRLEWLAHSFIEGIAALLPGTWVFRFGEVIGGLAWHLMRTRRNITLRNLRIAFAGEKDLPALHKMGKETFRRTGANLISAAHTARLPADQITSALRLDSFEPLRGALAHGKGVVLLLGHMGNWELLSRMLLLFPAGTIIGAFYRPLNNPLLDARVLKRRQADGTRMFSKRDNPLRVAAFLREGGVAGILADQRAGWQGQLVPFFGRLTRVSPLPSLLARRSKAEVLAMSVICEAPGKWLVTYQPIPHPHDTTRCMHALETAMRASPLDVFWLQERWKVFARPHRPISEWLGSDGQTGEKPHRALFWLADSTTPHKIPETWLHPDVIYEIALQTHATTPDWLPSTAKIHRIPSASLRKAVASIDTAAALPLDFILTHGPHPALTRAAATLSIPVICLPATAAPTQVSASQKP